MFEYRYPRPALATDIAIFSLKENRLCLLTIQRGQEPYAGKPALPGGFIKVGEETMEQCAVRELKEETSVDHASLWQFGVYSNPKRDPREHVVSVAYFACIRVGDVTLSGGSDARSAQWEDVLQLLGQSAKRGVMAFDHDQILRDAVVALAASLDTQPHVPMMLQRKFTLSQMQDATETILQAASLANGAGNGNSRDKRNFRRRIAESGWLEETEEMSAGAHRPARLYSLKNGPRSISSRK